MTQKKGNPHISCNVCSCAHHCDDSNCCTLTDITVCACSNCHSGCADGESMCASYQGK